jgi:Stress responsive A/B Barrel Domain
MIRHTVVFKLKHARASAQEQSFLQAARELAAIPCVRNFECLRQVSPKNNFDFGLSMEFASQQDYDAYNIHPDHERFVQMRWIPEVQDFLEIDYAPFATA